MVVKLSSKGQLTLPKKIRQLLKLKTGDRIQFSINKNGNIELTPVKSSLKDLKGMLDAPSRPVSLEEMEEAIAQAGSSIE